MKTLLFPVCLLGCSVALTLACGDDTDVAPPSSDAGVGGQGNQPDASGGAGGVTDPHMVPDSGNTMCAELGTYCHAFDDGVGVGADCHEAGHTGDEAACAAIYDECIAFCSSDAGHHEEDGGDAGHHEEDGGDAGHHEDAGHSDAGDGG